MHEWRLFLYLEDIRDLELPDPNVNYYIMLRLHNCTTAFKLPPSSSRYHSIKGIKIHYLFS
jgi:hypothetical protein